MKETDSNGKLCMVVHSLLVVPLRRCSTSAQRGLARYPRNEENIEPVHLFVSGRGAPQLPETDAPTYNLPEAEFLKELRWLKGSPKRLWSTLN